MRKYLVVSWSEESQTSYWDYIMAEDDGRAGEMVAAVRDDYSCVVEVFSIENLRDIVRKIERLTPDQINSDWDITKENHQEENKA